MRETYEPLLRLLTRSELKERYGSESQKVQLLFY
jgi:hypothetical protein